MDSDESSYTRLNKCHLPTPRRDIVSIMSSVDALKLKSSMTLFDAVSPGDVFADVLEKYYAGERDTLTLKMLETRP